jgi:hypothetical protein
MVRAASLVVFAVAASLWLRNIIDLLGFAVAVFGRFPIVSPVFIYAAMMAVAGLVLVPPLVGTFAASRRLVRPWIVTVVALFAIAVTAGFAYEAPAYTPDAPLRRMVRALQANSGGPSTWEVASIEPGLDLAPGAPAGWQRVSDPPPGWIPWGRLPHPFVFRTAGPPLGPAPVEVTESKLVQVAGGLELSIALVPREPGLTVSFVLPPGMAPARSNIPGLRRLGSWTATFVAVPPEGVLFRAAFNSNDVARLSTPLVLVTSSRLPGGSGWQSLPSWLPQEHAVWIASATWAVTPPVAHGEPLR